MAQHTRGWRTSKQRRVAAHLRPPRAPARRAPARLRAGPLLLALLALLLLWLLLRASVGASHSAHTPLRPRGLRPSGRRGAGPAATAIVHASQGGRR